MCIRDSYKGGRCSALAALGANLLHLKPCIEVRNGRMGVGLSLIHICEFRP